MNPDIHGATAATSQDDKTNVHCAGLILFALAGLIALHLLGFRFAFDASVGRSA